MPPPPRAFRRAFLATVAVLVVLAGTFAAFSTAQGPKLTETQVDTAAVVQSPGQQLRLFTNQAVAHVTAAQVSVTPSTPFTVTSSGTVIALQFTDRLAYSAVYSVRISGVTSVYRSRESTLGTRFTTGPARLYTLIRSPGADDQIVRAAVQSPGRQVVYRAPRIQAFASIGTDLVVVTDDRAESQMALVAADGTLDQLPLPRAGLVTGFALDAASGTIVFSMADTGRKAQALYTTKLSGTQRPVALPSPDKRAVVATSWVLMTDPPVVLARTPAGAVVRADLSLGGRTTLATTLSAGDREALDVASGPGADRVMLPGGGLASIDAGHLAVGGRTVYRAPAGSRVVALGASPNGQFVTLVTAAEASPPDGYTINPEPADVTTLVVDVGSGDVVASFAGSHLFW